MNILVVPTWYRTAKNPNGGVFVREEVKDLLSDEGNKVNASVLFVDLNFRNLSSVFKSPKFSETTFEGITEFRADGFGFPKVNLLMLDKWSQFHLQLMDEYLLKNPLPDVIHGHSFFGGYAAMKISQKFNIPYIVTEYFSAFLTGKIEGWKRKMIRTVFDNASKVVAVSEFLKSKVVDYTSNEVEVIPIAINTAFFRPGNFPNKNLFQFITVGGVRKEKQYDKLVEAFCQLPPIIRDKCCLKIIGNGPLEKNLIQQIEKLPSGNNVHYLGELNRHKVLENLQASNVFVCSSAYETFGVAVIEAMSVGLPVISTRCKGPEASINKETGVLTSMEEMANTMEWMFKNKDQFDSKKISAFVKDRFDISVLTQKRLSLYNEASKLLT